MSEVDPDAQLGALQAKIDAFFSRVHDKHQKQMSCGSGCSDCCQVRLTVTLVEAAAIFRALSGMKSSERAAVAERARSSQVGRCSALTDGGRCMIYAARPLVCRSHGAPIKRRENSLPIVDACFRNFGGDAEAADLDTEDVFDQETLSTILVAVDSAFADQVGAPRGTRIDLTELLADPDAIFG